MNVIRLEQVYPSVFGGKVPLGGESDVWGCSVEFRKGESTLLKAESGKGKTSLCSFVSGSRTDYDGRIMIDGADLRGMSDSEKLEYRKSSLAILHQDLKLFSELNALDNVMVKSRLNCGISVDEAGEMLLKLGLEESMLRRPVRTLSLGQQQRVAFVRMLSFPADFRILDEPVSHLDTQSASVMAEMLHNVSAADGAGVIVTSVGYDFPYKYDKVLKL